MHDFNSKRLWGPTPKYDLVKSYKHPHNDFTMIAGPCSVENPQQIFALAEFVARIGATHLRGGVFRAGTYPGKNFGYIDEELIQYFWFAAKRYNLKNIIEVLDYSEDQMSMIDKYSNCYQVGCRQMQNYTLLRKVGSSGKPVFLKRNPGSTMDEWLGAAEHVLTAGCKELYLIERGTSNHLNHVRWDLSISIIPAIQKITDIPVIVDGSHGTGRRDLVGHMTLAGVAAGAKGCLIEVHESPDHSISDAEQAIDPEEFKKIVGKIKQIREVIKE